MKNGEYLSILRDVNNDNFDQLIQNISLIPYHDNPSVYNPPGLNSTYTRQATYGIMILDVYVDLHKVDPKRLIEELIKLGGLSDTVTRVSCEKIVNRFDVDPFLYNLIDCGYDLDRMLTFLKSNIIANQFTEMAVLMFLNRWFEGPSRLMSNKNLKSILDYNHGTMASSVNNKLLTCLDMRSNKINILDGFDSRLSFYYRNIMSVCFSKWPKFSRYTSEKFFRMCPPSILNEVNVNTQSLVEAGVYDMFLDSPVGQCYQTKILSEVHDS